MNRRQHTAELLRAHQPSDEVEADFVTRMLALARAPGDPFSRDHYSPGHFTASAFVLSPTRDELLLILHGKLHRWLQPGGHIDPDDADVFSAARREVAEETGIRALHILGDGLFDVDIHEIPPLGGQPGHQHFDLRILLVAHTLDLQAGDDAKDARWVPLADVNEVESDASVMRAVGKLLRR